MPDLRNGRHRAQPAKKYGSQWGAQSGYFCSESSQLRAHLASITRHGRPAAFIVSPQDMDDLLDVRRKRTRAVTELTEWSERARQRLTQSAASLTDSDIVRLVHEAR